MNIQKMITDIQNLEVNVSKTERVVSILSGSLLLYDSLAKKPKSFTQAFLSGFMIFRGATGHCPGYSIARKTSERKKTEGITVRANLTINKPADFVYHFWRKLENLPLFMKHLESVTVLDDEISEWKARIPGNLGNLAWKAAVIKDVKGKEIAWRSFSDAAIHNIGKIEFHKNNTFGTRMKVLISYQVPFGTTGETAAKVLNPFFQNMIEQDILRFKEYVENQ